MKWLSTRMLPAVFLLGIAAGCFQENYGVVTGTVTVDGEPMGGFEVKYTSDTDGSLALGYAIVDGSYQLYRGRGNERIRVGSYTVTVSPSGFVDGCPAPRVKLRQSEFSRTVEPGSNVLDLELETASR